MAPGTLRPISLRDELLAAREAWPRSHRAGREAGLLPVPRPGAHWRSSPGARTPRCFLAVSTRACARLLGALARQRGRTSRPSLPGRAGLSPASPRSHARGTVNVETGDSYVNLGVWVAGIPPELGET